MERQGIEAKRGMKAPEWEYRDVPITQFKVVTEPNPVTGEIKQIVDICGRAQQQLIHTKSEQIRNALIDLGWRPPELEDDHILSRLERMNAELEASTLNVRGRLLTYWTRADLLVIAALTCKAVFEEANEGRTDPATDTADLQPRREPAVPQ